jgi:hypothetical protein
LGRTVGECKVNDPDFPVGVKHDVGRTERAMKCGVGMEVHQGAGNAIHGFGFYGRCPGVWGTTKDSLETPMLEEFGIDGFRQEVVTDAVRKSGVSWDLEKNFNLGHEALRFGVASGYSLHKIIARGGETLDKENLANSTDGKLTDDFEVQFGNNPMVEVDHQFDGFKADRSGRDGWP